jgi:hypothetical protein
MAVRPVQQYQASHSSSPNKNYHLTLTDSSNAPLSFLFSPNPPPTLLRPRLSRLCPWYFFGFPDPSPLLCRDYFGSVRSSIFLNIQISRIVRSALRSALDISVPPPHPFSSFQVCGLRIGCPLSRSGFVCSCSCAISFFSGLPQIWLLPCYLPGRQLRVAKCDR